MFTQSVSWEKTSNMQSQNELYSFLGDRVGGFHCSAVRRGLDNDIRSICNVKHKSMKFQLHKKKNFSLVYSAQRSQCISKADKRVIAYSEKISYFFTSEEYDLYFFTAANRGYFVNSGLYFFSKRSGMHRSYLALRYGCTHVK